MLVYFRLLFPEPRASARAMMQDHGRYTISHPRMVVLRRSPPESKEAGVGRYGQARLPVSPGPAARAKMFARGTQPNPIHHIMCDGPLDSTFA